MATITLLILRPVINVQLQSHRDAIIAINAISKSFVYILFPFQEILINFAAVDVCCEWIIIACGLEIA